MIAAVTAYGLVVALSIMILAIVYSYLVGRFCLAAPYLPFGTLVRVSRSSGVTVALKIVQSITGGGGVSFRPAVCTYKCATAVYRTQ